MIAELLVAEPTTMAAASASISVCTSCGGSQATLSDLEDLCSYVGIEARPSGCMGACGSGPNIIVTTPGKGSP